jgi:hypothetical protein
MKLPLHVASKVEGLINQGVTMDKKKIKLQL